MEEYLLKKLFDAAFQYGSKYLDKVIEKSNHEQLINKKKNEGKELEAKTRALRLKLQKKGEDKKSIAEQINRLRTLRTKEIEKTVLSNNERYKCNVSASIDGVINGIDRHEKYIKKWSSRVNFSDLNNAKALNSIYVELDTYLCPSRLHFDEGEKINKIKLNDVFINKKNNIILGHPGAGKTTSMKKLCSMYFGDKRDLFTNVDFLLLIRFRDLNYGENYKYPIHRKISELLNIDIHYESSSDDDKKHYFLKEYITSILHEIRPLIILDGYDEFPYKENENDLLSEVKSLIHYEKTRLYITSRTGDFNYSIDNAEIYEIAPLTLDQIEEFSEKWIVPPQSYKCFLADIKNSPFCDATIKPLTLAHLCAIYTRIGKIPKKPKTIYRKVVNLLLEEWDEQRLVIRSSKYPEFISERKFEFLCFLAYILTVEFKSTVFTHDDFIQAYKRICQNFSMDASDSKLIASELESQSGLFINSGYERYEFSHKSIQEYLTAEYVVRLPSIPKTRDILMYLGNELAVAVSLSLNSTDYFCELARIIIKSNAEQKFIDIFINRIVIESPDFGNTLEFVISVLHLFTLRYKVKEDGSNQNIIKSNNAHLDENASKYIHLITGKSCIESILDHYKKVEIIGAHKNMQYLKRKRGEMHKELYPNILVCPMVI